MDCELAIRTIKESCYQVGYPTNDAEHERRQLINQSCDYAIDCIEKLEQIKKILDAPSYVENGITYSYCYDSDTKLKHIREVVKKE